MADVTITSLPAASSVAGADLHPIVQSGTTKNATFTMVKDYCAGFFEPLSTATTVKVSGSDYTSTNTALTDITGLTFAASASTLYEVDVLLIGQQTGTGGSRFAYKFSAAGATGNGFMEGNSVAATFVGGCNAIGTEPAFTYWTTANTNGSVFGKAFILIGANTGNITIQGRSITAAQTLTVKIGSRMIVTPR